MKKHLAVLCLTAVLASALLLAGCGKTPEAAGAAARTPPPAAMPSPAPLPLRGLQPYNSRAWYVEKIDMEQDKWVLHRYDFASASVSVLPLPRANEYPVVLADEEDLYAFYMGGAMAGAAVYRGDPDTAAWDCLLELPEGNYIDAQDPVASDGQALYFGYCTVSSDPHAVDPVQLVRFDLATRELTTLTDWEGPFRGRLYGVWQERGKLLYTRRVLAENCPVEPEIGYYKVENTQELAPWLATVLYALDPQNGETAELLREEGAVPTLSWQLFADTLYRTVPQHDGGAALQWRALGADTAGEKALDVPVSLSAVYAEDIFLFGAPEGKDTLYVYDRAAATLAPSPLRCLRKGEDSCIDVVCPAGPGEYLVVRDRTIREELRRGMTEWDFYTATVYPEEYEIISRAGLLDETIPGRPLTQPEGWYN